MKKPKMSLFVSDRKEVNAFSLNENMLIVDSTRRDPKKNIRTSQDTLIIIKALDFTGHPGSY
jgi:hypothetical protein